jgi:uncharacterized protein YsxB (DUF464 family)
MRGIEQACAFFVVCAGVSLFMAAAANILDVVLH